MKLTKIGASWCCQCKAQAAEIAKIRDTFPDLEIEELDADKLSDEELDKFAIRNLPVLILTEGEETLGRKSTLTTKADLIEWINSVK